MVRPTVDNLVLNGEAARKAVLTDIEGMKKFILQHGPSEWNNLDGVEAHLDEICTDKTEAMLAFEGSELIGFISYNPRKKLAERYLHEEDVGKECGYLAEAVVHAGYTGRGIGRQLAELIKTDLLARGVNTIYVLHHEKNISSRKAWERAGFSFVKTIYGPEIRPNDSQRTTIQRFVAQ